MRSKINRFNILYLLLLLGFFQAKPVYSQGKNMLATDLLVVGGGASGISAGIQAARQGIKTTIIEETEWLGGMLTAAGVSAIDGNHQMPSGIWGEFRDSIYARYGGPKKVATGWVSHTLFEPSVGNQIFRNIAQSLPLLAIRYQTEFFAISRKDDLWHVEVNQGKKTYTIEAKVVIDATELGDVMAALSLPYDVGMESQAASGEKYAPLEANDIVQDLTYTVILQDFGKPSIIKKPKGYNPKPFECACEQVEDEQAPTANCIQMLDYARLPNNKYLINWPNCGNDYYVNLTKLDPEAQEAALADAKNFSLQFVYYIQTVLGFPQLGIADDEFPSKDGLPLIPYHRESRRLKGKVRLNAHHLEHTYTHQEKLYRTGVAVGDYPIDHHHTKNSAAPEIDFIDIKIPSYNVPLGALIPAAQAPNFIVTEKSISVSNIVNGTTRLQPVVLGIGQAAGAIAAYSIKNNIDTDRVPIRKIQETLLNSNAYIMPFIDVKPDHPDFITIQKIGATGIIKGVGIPYKWANETWFYPENNISEHEIVDGLKGFYTHAKISEGSGKALTLSFLSDLVEEVSPELTNELIQTKLGDIMLLRKLDENSELNRLQTALIIHEILNPFEIPVNFKGEVLFDKTDKNTLE